MSSIVLKHYAVLWQFFWCCGSCCENSQEHANTSCRLATWYLIITLLFRCPSSLSSLDASFARVCKPYLQTRSLAAPYLDPYYETYAAPYVAKVKPYTDRFEQQIYSPAAKFTVDKYATYGAHRVDQAQAYGASQWDKTVRPQLESAQEKIQGQYDQYLGPHVKTLSTAANPYYTNVKASLEEIYHLSVLPAYEASLPYLHKARAQGNHVVVHLVFPYVRAGKDATLAFLMRTVWPRIRVIYGANVEPQLVRISERLGRYRDQQKVESVVDSMESTTVAPESTKIVPTVAASGASSSAPPTSSASASASASTKAGWGVFDDFFGGESSSTGDEVQTSSTAKAKPSKPPQPTGEALQASLNEDLRKWQSKFATAADKGAEDLEQRVAEITKRQIESGVQGHGRALVTNLEETAETTLSALKTYIIHTVTSTPDSASESDLEALHAKCSAKTRELGLSVKSRAQAVRTWKATHDAETDALVKAAVRSTVEVLEKIHGLGLQEVGMRWAWLDGVTYKDWQNYHKLRNTLNEWQAEVEAVGARHDGLKAAHDAAKTLEDEAMDVAARMVNELVRLKDVARWKIWARDASDDFTNKVVPARGFEGIQHSPSPFAESLASASSKASEAIQDIPSQASNAVLGSSASQASSAIVGSQPPLSDEAASSAKSAVSQASSIVVGSQAALSEKVVSSAKSVASGV